MSRPRQQGASRTRERRLRLAHEAARLMSEGGISDFHLAKRKAASRLGINDDASLPRNSEVEEALREHQRLFHGPEQGDALRLRRQAALNALEFFAPFQPRLVGPVLEGTADANSAVTLQLYPEHAEEVPVFLDEQGIPATERSRRIRLDRSRSGDFPVWVFSADDLTIDLTVLPQLALRQAPLSNIDGKPMARASAAQLKLLLDEGK
ncbi:hypothetical protein WCE55_12305 [Luteimonas sp. MJ293]|uniref:hypothetical protein n=1 Tax=Luteimonas sp. MJ146 TaxID=3129240 RepID=UPI0031BB0A6E